jgi:hypothetical protein
LKEILVFVEALVGGTSRNVPQAEARRHVLASEFLPERKILYDAAPLLKSCERKSR